MMEKYIKHILFIFLGLFVLTNQAYSQCTVPVQPINVVATDLGGGNVKIVWDINCAARTGNSTCGNADGSSVFYYVGVYNQASPASNSTIMEYGSSTFYGTGCDNTIVRDGGGTATNCFDPKGSTCADSEVGQSFGGATRTGTFSAETLCSADVFGEGAGKMSVSLNVCEGGSYDVFVWEIISDQAPNFDPNPKPSVGENVACGLSGVIAESNSSTVATVDMSGTLSIMSPPQLVVTGSIVCGGDATYTSIHQTEPLVTVLPGCITTTDQLVGASTLLADTLISGTGDIAGGTAILGPNVVLINCRDNLLISLPAPTGCKGIRTLNTPPVLCNPSITTYSNAAVYMYSGGDNPEEDIYYPSTRNTFPACYFTETGSTNSCDSNTGSDNDYPNNYTAAFGAWIVSDGAGGNCLTNVVGNPFQNGLSPFDLPGTRIGIPDGATDGVERYISTLCVRYEDDCNGTKATTCVKFISDATPMVGTIAGFSETCGGVADQIIRVTVEGGTPDPNSDGTVGAFPYDVSASTLNGTLVALTFNATADPKVWETTPGAIATGEYTVIVRDPLAAGCGSACDLTATFRVSPLIPATIGLENAAVLCPVACEPVNLQFEINNIVEYEVTGTIDGAALGGGCPFLTAALIAPFENISSPSAPAGGTCSSVIGGGVLDALMVEVCFSITAAPTQSFDDIYVSVDNGATFENLYVGTVWTGGTETSADGATVNFCTSTPIGTSYDGTLDGSSGGAGFNGVDPNNFVLFVGQSTTAGGPCPGATVNSATIKITDRCVEPTLKDVETDICVEPGATTDAQPTVITLSPQAGAPVAAAAGDDGLFLDLVTGKGEFCSGFLAAGTYTYDVSGAHVSGPSLDRCCPATGTISFDVLAAPPAPVIGGLVDGAEYCSDDQVVAMNITPPVDLTPGGVILSNYAGGSFPTEWLAGLYDTGGILLFGSDIRDGRHCNGGAGNSSGLDTDVLGMVDLPPGDYELSVGESFGDGLDGATFTFADHCGNILTTEADHAGACGGAGSPVLTFPFTVLAPSLTVTGPGIVNTSLPDANGADGLPNSGDETYEFDPNLANLAATDGSNCNSNSINVMFVDACGCTVDNDYEIIVYEAITAFDPAAKVAADCSAGGDVTFTAAVDLASILGGTGSYAMSYEYYDMAGTIQTVTNVPLADITIPGYTNISPLAVTISDGDAAYMDSFTNGVGDPQNCDGNACSTIVNLAFEACCDPTQPNPTIINYRICEGGTLPVGEGLQALCPDCPFTPLVALTRTETYSGPTIGYDGNLSTGPNPNVDLTFPTGYTISEVEVQVTFLRADGATGGNEASFCGVGDQGGNNFWNEPGMTVISPLGTQVNLFSPGDWSGATHQGTQTLTFSSDGIAIPGGIPVDLTDYIPTGDITTLFGQNATGIWELAALDNTNQDFMCIEAFSIIVTAIPPPIAPDVASITWWDDPTAGTQVGTGTTFPPTDLTNGVYGYYVQCECNGCESNRSLVQFTIDPTPSVGEAIPDDQLLCCGESVTITNPSASYDGTLAGLNPSSDYSLGYAITSGSQTTVSSQATIDAAATADASYVFQANALDGTDDGATIGATSCTACPGGTANAPLSAGVYSITPFLSVDEHNINAAFEIAANMPATVNPAFEAYVNTYTPEGSLNNTAVPASSFSLAIDVYDIIDQFDGDGSSGAGCEMTDLNVIVYVDNVQVGAQFGLTDAVQVVTFTEVDFNLNSNNAIRVEVAFSTAGNGCSVTNTNLTEEKFYAGFNTTLQATFQPTFPDIGEGALCTNFGTPTDFVVLDPICASETTTCSVAGTYDVIVTASGGLKVLDGTSYINATSGLPVTINGDYEIDASGATMIDGVAGTTANGAGPFTITYPIGTPAYTIDIYNWDNNSSARMQSGCPFQITGSISVPSSDPVTSSTAICQGSAVMNLTSTMPSCPSGTPNITWWDAPTGGLQVGSGASFDPTGTTSEEATPFDINTAGVYTYYAMADCSGCINTTRVAATIQVDEAPIPVAGTDGIVCLDNTNLAATAATIGVGMWSTSSPTNITDLASPTSGVTVLPLGASTFTWTITNGTCVVSDDVIISRNAPPTANAGNDLVVCDGEAAQLAASLGGTANSGNWSGGLGMFSNPANPSATYSSDPTEEGTIVTLTWTSDDPDGAGIGCPVATDDVDVTISPVPVAILTCPSAVLDRCASGIVTLEQNDTNPLTAPTSTGVFGGNAAVFISGDSSPGGVATFNPLDMPTGIPLTLTYTVSLNGCTNQTSCTFTVEDNRTTNSGGY